MTMWGELSTYTLHEYDAEMLSGVCGRILFFQEVQSGAKSVGWQRLRGTHGAHGDQETRATRGKAARPHRSWETEQPAQRHWIGGMMVSRKSWDNVYLM